MSVSIGDRDRAVMELVISADNMDNATFAKHMNFRHKDSLGGLLALDFRGKEHLVPTWRSFHRRLHQIRVDLNHEHLPYEPALGTSGGSRAG